MHRLVSNFQADKQTEGMMKISSDIVGGKKKLIAVHQLVFWQDC